MPFVHRCGAQVGPLVVYFHGAPGAPTECGRFHGPALASGVQLLSLDRGALDGALQGDAYFQALADETAGVADGASIHLVGFSLGAFVAIRVAPLLGDQAASLHLISAAAPLDSGDFLESMAGRSVFRAAARQPATFRAMTRVQGWVAAHAPGVLWRMLFANAADADRELAADARFKADIGAALRTALGPRAVGYKRDVSAYVTPWREHLARVVTDTTLWHGGEDTWAPPAMADALASAIPGARRTHLLAKLSHYSCLDHAMPLIMAELGAGRGKTT